MPKGANSCQRLFAKATVAGLNVCCGDEQATVIEASTVALGVSSLAVSLRGSSRIQGPLRGCGIPGFPEEFGRCAQKRCWAKTARPGQQCPGLGLSTGSLPLLKCESYRTNWPLTTIRILWEEKAIGEVSSKNLLEQPGNENEENSEHHYLKPGKQRVKSLQFQKG